nr:M15 family metallopeptidase [uncultured Noviherbaspirillum sp.]
MTQHWKPACIAFLAIPLLLLHAAPALAALDGPACTRLQERGVIDASAPVGCDRLAVVRFPYIDFDGRHHDDGELMVLAAVAPEVRQLFQRLYQRRFPLARARLIERYHGDDAASMQDNNTSAFNNRPVTGGGPPSLHAYGLAIDINPVQNPFIQPRRQGNARVSPAAGNAHLDRRGASTGSSPRPGMAEDVAALFAEVGFTVWGGNWKSPVDYQHFQFTRAFAEKLANLPEKQARQYYLEQLARLGNCLREEARNQAKKAGTTCALK